ncbi:hypothetical protein RCH09_003546 [Actimicrobium sp. GrIS 1.19]|uniref:DUF3348 domain-containing protein n=1 Tax=Actimicrobium sp. GrIS 1.19 TaxID=3071708 RepID=UPI002E0B5EBB|nr:hypothetical protein [Actimicrobium sp. GrIS 1.19]
MTRAFPRTNFHSSELIRCLTDLAIVEVVEPGPAFAEKLGMWIHFADAIALSAVHGDSPAGAPSAAAGAAAGPDAALTREFARIEARLTQSIIDSGAPGLARAHIKLPTPVLALPMDIAASFAPYRRFYDAHQRDMEMTIQPLRVNVREALANTSPRLRKLAELDAVLEKILRERESKLLASVPLLLKKRFTDLFHTHQQQLVDARQDDNPVSWTRPGGWLARFCADLQTLLQAELALRLQPTAGLLEAFNEQKSNA